MRDQIFRLECYLKLQPQEVQMVNVTKLPVTQKLSEPTFAGGVWHPFEGLRKEVDRLFDEFGGDFWRPFRPLAASEMNWPKKFATAPAVDVAETDKSYEI